jgi:hypothetical protein
MNKITVILKLDSTGVHLTDQFGSKQKNPFELVIGSAVELIFDLRCGEISPQTSALLPLDKTIVKECTGFYFAIDRDFNQKTAPLFLKTSGFETEFSEERTALHLFIPNTAASELVNALGSSKTAEFTCEIAGINENGAAVFSCLFALNIRNRIFINTEFPPDNVISDPAYLNTAETIALIAAEAGKAAAMNIPEINSSGNWQINENDTGIPARGPQGIPGEKGDTGEKGEKGDTGPQGPQGERGAAFRIDATGLLSERSGYDAEAKDFSFLATDDGNVYIKQSDSSGDWSNAIPFKGDKGEKGDKGDKGDTGPVGQQGAKGDKGDKGDTGDTGATGADGKDGADGTTPIRGVDYWTEADKNEIKSYCEDAILNGEW